MQKSEVPLIGRYVDRGIFIETVRQSKAIDEVNEQ